MGAEALSGAGSSRSGRSGAGRSGAGRAGSPGSGRTKSGKPRPGTGGHGRRALEGKGPTPPAALRPGHPAQRRAAAASAGSRRPRRDDEPSASAGPRGPRRADTPSASARAGRGAAAPSGSSARAPRGSGDAAEFVAGRNPVVESLRAAVPAAALYVGARVQHDERISEAIKLAADRGVAVLEAGASELDRLTGGALHQGLALRVRPYDYAHPDDLLARAADAGQLPLIVALDGVTDPRNLGAVARSAAAFGAHGVVVPARRGAGVTAGAWKASAGALARVPVARAANLARTLASYRDAGVFVAGLDAAGDTPVRELELATAPLTLVIGSEGRGLSRIVAQACDVLVRIPIAARTESLNAGVAAGIALYEVAAIRSRPTRSG
jgi:23S rRNA (guanosine2251-2'-O)-methyltransferase